MLTLGRVASRVVQVWSRMQQVLVQKVWVGFSTDFPREARGQQQRTALRGAATGRLLSVGQRILFLFLLLLLLPDASAARLWAQLRGSREGGCTASATLDPIAEAVMAYCRPATQTGRR